jgi:long-subunit acyl-CoA synthetase (AMP-forming)
MLTHSNVMSALGGFNKIDPSTKSSPTTTEEQETQLSYLPLAHIMVPF